MSPTFGVAVPAFASPGGGLFRTPDLPLLDARLCLDFAREAEAAGFGSIWAPDHLMIGRDQAVLEGWTLLTAIAATTGRARLGLIQQSNLFRHPGVLAKAIATLDQIAPGRFTLFQNFGSKRAETVAFGLAFDEAEADRVARSAEALAVMRQLWTAAGPSHHKGRFYALAGAVSEPKPADVPPIWFAGTQPDNLALLAEIGSGWCTPPVTLAEFRERLAAVEAALAARGRSCAQIEIALETQILVAPDLAALRQRLAGMVAHDPQGGLAGRPPVAPEALAAFVAGRTDDLPEEITEKWLVGTPAMVAARLAAFVRAGVSHFILWFMDLPHRGGFECFVREVMPQFSAKVTDAS